MNSPELSAISDARDGVEAADARTELVYGLDGETKIQTDLIIILKSSQT
jgi:hypothetical protein